MSGSQSRRLPLLRPESTVAQAIAAADATDAPAVALSGDQGFTLLTTALLKNAASDGNGSVRVGRLEGKALKPDLFWVQQQDGSQPLGPSGHFPVIPTQIDRNALRSHPSMSNFDLRGKPAPPSVAMAMLVEDLYICPNATCNSNVANSAIDCPKDSAHGRFILLSSG